MNKKEKVEYLYTHYYKQMHTIAFCILEDYYHAEDACQDTMIKLLDVVDHVNDITSESAKNLCLVILRNTARDIARKWHRQIPTEMEYDEGEVPSTVDAYPFQTEDIVKDILELPEHYSMVIVLRCLENKSCKETAMMLGSSICTINSRLSRAKKILREKWNIVA